MELGNYKRLRNIEKSVFSVEYIVRAVYSKTVLNNNQTDEPADCVDWKWKG